MSRSPKARPTSLYSIQTTSSIATLSSTFPPSSPVISSPTMSPRRDLATKENQYLGLHSAAAAGNLGLVKFALDHGAPIDAALNGFLPLQMACISDSNIPVVMFLIQRGADVNARITSRRQTGERSSIVSASLGSTALHVAAAHNSIRCVDYLLRCGAIVDLADKYGATALSVAQSSNNTEIAEMLNSSVANNDNDTQSVTTEFSPEPISSSLSNDDSVLSLTRQASLPLLAEASRAMGSISSVSSDSSDYSATSDLTTSTAPSSILSTSPSGHSYHRSGSIVPLDGCDQSRRSFSSPRPKSLPPTSDFTIPAFLMDPPRPSSVRASIHSSRSSSESQRPRPPPLNIEITQNYSLSSQKSNESMRGINTLPTPPPTPATMPYDPFHPTTSMPSLIPREEDFTLPPSSWRNRPLLKKRWSDSRTTTTQPLALTRTLSSGSTKERPIFNKVLNLNLRPTLQRNNSVSNSIISTSSYSISATPPPSPTSAYMAATITPTFKQRWMSLRGKKEYKEESGRVSLEAVRRSMDFARAAIVIEKNEKKERRKRRKGKVGKVVEKIKDFFKH